MMKRVCALTPETTMPLQDATSDLNNMRVTACASFFVCVCICLNAHRAGAFRRINTNAGPLIVDTQTHKQNLRKPSGPPCCLNLTPCSVPNLCRSTPRRNLIRRDKHWKSQPLEMHPRAVFSRSVRGLIGRLCSCCSHFGHASTTARFLAAASERK